MKKWLICLTVLFSAFLFTNKVNAYQLGDYQVDDDAINTCNNLNYNNYTIINGKTWKKSYENLFICSYNPLTWEEHSSGTSEGNYRVSLYAEIRDYTNTTYSSTNKFYYAGFHSDRNNLNRSYKIFSDNSDITSTIQAYGVSWIGNFYYTGDSNNTSNLNIKYSNYDMLISGSPYEDRVGEIYHNNDNTPKEFTINTYDTEHGGHWFGVNYIQGQQDNTVNFYIQDSGILTISAAKGYEIEKIYYDEALTQEANLNDIVETDTNLYVTWKSKIEINKQIATDLSGNDVITITYDFNKIYNENYTYWISNDGTNYVDITDRLNSNHKYASGVYFAGDYFARVQDENNETISVHYINIDYYRITPTTEIGKDIDENGNIKPYVILDYSAYREIKNNIICEYSIDNGNTWIDITKELDINMKYKLYINVGDKVTSRVRTNGNTILPGETGGSNYDVTEDFYNDILINEEKDVLEEFKDLLTNKNDNIFIKFKEVWEAFKDSVLFNYIYILIVGSLIILIIKSAKRN